MIAGSQRVLQARSVLTARSSDRTAGRGRSARERKWEPCSHSLRQSGRRESGDARRQALAPGVRHAYTPSPSPRLSSKVLAALGLDFMQDRIMLFCIMLHRDLSFLDRHEEMAR